MPRAEKLEFLPVAIVVMTVDAMIIVVVIVVITVMVVVVIICRSRRRRDRAEQQSEPYGTADQQSLHGFLPVIGCRAQR